MDIVLEKDIFSIVFENDIRRVFLYKKAERLAKALHLIRPAFREAQYLKDRFDTASISLIEDALLPYASARSHLSRSLLTLSSLISIARGSGYLSAMNTDVIMQEVSFFLKEIASYEEPRVSLEETPSIAHLVRSMQQYDHQSPGDKVPSIPAPRTVRTSEGTPSIDKGHVKDRRNQILSVIKDKGTVNIKDISLVIRNVSEKTIQRELNTLILQGIVRKQGERRWSTYSLH